MDAFAKEMLTVEDLQISKTDFNRVAKYQSHHCLKLLKKVLIKQHTHYSNDNLMIQKQWFNKIQHKSLMVSNVQKNFNQTWIDAFFSRKSKKAKRS